MKNDTKEKIKNYTGVRERTPGNYEINFRPFRGSKAVYRNICAASPRKASQERARLMVEAQNSSSGNNLALEAQERQETSFSAIWPILEENIKKDEVTRKTLLGLNRVYHRMFFDFLKIKYPNIISPSKLMYSFFEEYQGYWAVTLNHPRGLRAESGRLKIIMNRLYNLGFVSRDLIEDLEKLRIPKRRKKDFPELTVTEMKAFMTRIKHERPDIYGLVYFMLRAGRRIEEVTLIERKRDVVWDGFNPIKINIRAETTKMDEQAPLYFLDEDLRTHIRIYYTTNKDHQAPYLFLNKRFEKMTQEMVANYLGDLSEEMFQKRITSHYFRHYLCTMAGKANLPIVDIQAITGIRDVNTLLRFYSHSTEEGQKNALERTRL